MDLTFSVDLTPLDESLDESHLKSLNSAEQRRERINRMKQAKMARTKGTARGSFGAPANPPDEVEDQEMTAHLTEEDKRKREELEKAPMQLEVKDLEKRWTSKGRLYVCEPKEEEDLPEQINWHEKFALCVSAAPHHSDFSRQNLTESTPGHPPI